MFSASSMKKSVVKHLKNIAQFLNATKVSAPSPKTYASLVTRR